MVEHMPNFTIFVSTFHGSYSALHLFVCCFPGDAASFREPMTTSSAIAAISILFLLSLSPAQPAHHVPHQTMTQTRNACRSFLYPSHPASRIPDGLNQ